MNIKLTQAYFIICLLTGLTLVGCSLDNMKFIQIHLPNDQSIDMIHIPAGSFVMGSPKTEAGHEPDEVPVHQVTFNYNYYIGKTEITQAQWLSLMGNWPDSTDQPSTEEGLGDDYPAYYVSWEDCQRFLLALNQHTESTNQHITRFRLPSEAEWEYACRAGTITRFYFGDSLTGINGQIAEDFMWYKGNNSPAGTKPVGQKLHNSWGLFDMHGNVWEWCQDWYHSSYEGAPTDGSAWEDPPGIYRILHGGDWDNEAKTCRSANRNDHRGPGDRSADLGFRIVATANNDR
jgi:formylglycine-generating enzyme required for sulfatase activity